MKKLIGLFLLTSFSWLPVYAAKIAVTVGNGTLQPNTTAGYNVSSGTVGDFSFANGKTTGTFTLNGATVTSSNALFAGTAIQTATVTFRGGEFSGTRNDNSTTTLIGAVTNGTSTDNSTTTLQGAVLNGTKTDNSTTTATGSWNFTNQRLQNISSATVASDATRYSQNKMLQTVDNAVSAASSTISATYGKTNISLTITVLNASSKVNLMASFTASNSAVQNNCEYKITRNGNAITNTNTVGFGSSGVATGSLQYGMFLLGSDLPGASGATTYEVSFRNLSGGITCTTGGTTTPAMIRADEINGL